MKKISISLVLLLASTVLAFAGSKTGNEVKTPSQALKAFKAQYTNAMNVKWEKEGADFEAVFQIAGITYDAQFTKEGKWVATESKSDATNFPADAIAYAKKNYSGYGIEEYLSVNNPEGSFLVISVKKYKEEIDLYFDASGKFIKKDQD